MSGTVTTIGSVAGATAYAPSLSSGTAAEAVSTAQATPTGNGQTHFSPRLIVDPVAGVITEYLDKKGNVQDQTPSSAVVAYLRAGLTSEGFSKSSSITEQATTSSIA